MNVETMKTSTEVAALSPYLDFRMSRTMGLAVLFKGEERGFVKSETSDRTYTVARDVWGETVVVADCFGEAMVRLVPELRQLEVAQ